MQLTPEEVELLASYKDSELYRVFQKAFDVELAKTTALIINSPSTECVRFQGMLQGITACKNMVNYYVRAQEIKNLQKPQPIQKV